MRLLHISHQYAPVVGGAEKYITDLSEALAGRGHEVDVFTSRSRDYHTWRNELPPFERINGVNVYRFNSVGRGPAVMAALRFGLGGYWPARRRLYEPFLFVGNGPVMPGLWRATFQRAVQYDAVHINHLHYAHAATAAHALRLRRLPYVITPHVHAEQRETFDAGYMRRVLGEAQAVLADTPAEQEFIAQQGLSRRVALGGVGLNMADYPPLECAAARARLGLRPDAFVMLFLGRKAAYKGLQHCLRAFMELRRQGHDRLVFMALGPETEQSRALWEEHRRAWGETPGLIVRDAVSDEERLAALAACDVFTLPSTGEAFGIVFLEAWAYGKPVIGAAIRSVSTLIDEGRDGWLVEPERPSQLRGRLEALLADPSLGRRAGEAGRAKLLRRYTAGRIAETVEGLYLRVQRHTGCGGRPNLQERTE